MRMSIAILFVGIAQIGCSSSYMVSSSPDDEHISFSKLNALLVNESATIVRQDGSETHGRGILATPDSTSWRDPTTAVRSAVPTQIIKKIVLTYRGLGLLEGAGIGVLAGGAAGLLAAVVSGPHRAEEGIAYVVLPILGVGSGLIIGPIYGVIKGHTYEYEFANELKKP